jgi:glycosyltransferase involved in cell wall biosynthesis
MMLNSAPDQEIKTNIKKILFLHASAEMYGSDRVLLNLILSLDREKYSPFVIIPFNGPLEEEFKKHAIAYRILKLPVLRRDLFSPLGILQYIWRFILCSFQMTSIIFTEKITIIHTNTSAVLIGGFLSVLLGKKHVWQVMEIIEKPYLLRYVLTKIVGIFSTKVFCISDAVRDHFLALTPTKRRSKYETLYHGVDLSEYQFSKNSRDQIRNKLGLDEDTVVTGFIGRLNAWKGQDVFFDAAKKCLSLPGRQKTHFIIIGSCFQGQEKYRISLEHQLSENTQLRSKISLFGFQNNIHEWLSALDIFVLPSKLPEPNATILLAAMAESLPVIGTNIGGTVETILDTQTGLLIPPENTDALCEKILYLASNKDIRMKMGINGLERVKNIFSLELYNKTIQSAYE